jgi:hypothetical protein
MFAVDLGGPLKGLPLNFVEVTLQNRSQEERAAFFSSAYRFSAPINRLQMNNRYLGLADYRFPQRFDLIPEKYTRETEYNPSTANGRALFNPKWRYTIGQDGLIRDGQLLYLFPVSPAPEQVSLALGDHGFRMRRYFSGEIAGEPDPEYTLDPHTPVGVVAYRVVLQPGASQRLVFKMPIVPLPDDSSEASMVREADYDQHFAETVEAWQELVGDSPPLRFPEEKVQQYLLANTVANLLAIDQVGTDLIVNVNKFQYHDPYGGANTANMVRGFEYMGLLDIARKCLLYNRKVQNPDGSFRMNRHPDWFYGELFGYIMWAWNRHYELTGDRDFLQQVYPGVREAMNWHLSIVGDDPLGLLPPSEIADDAFLKDTRQTGMHMWVLIGLHNAVEMAEAMGRPADASEFETERQRFRMAFDRQLEKQTRQTGGYIPPGLDRTVQGNDWDNLLTLYPEPLFDPDDPRVVATLENVRSRYAEGVLSFVHPAAIGKKGDKLIFDQQATLHYWQTPNNAQASLVRRTAEDQQWALKELYALLLHTTSTHLPGEYGTIPWSTRKTSHVFNLLPQGATSAKTIELLRNMLVREYEKDLYLFSAVSPEWMKPGKVIEVSNQPTEFGPIWAKLTITEDGFKVSLKNRFRTAPSQIFVCVPWFFEVKEVRVDGGPSRMEKGRIGIDPKAESVQVKGRIAPETPEMSYKQAVTEYKREYLRRYESFLKTGRID